MLPGLFVYILVGTTLPNLAEAMSGNYDGGLLTLSILIFGIILLLATIIYIAKLAFKFLDKIVHISEEQRDIEGTLKEPLNRGDYSNGMESGVTIES